MRRNVRSSKNLVRIMWRNHTFLGSAVIKLAVLVNTHPELSAVDEPGATVRHPHWLTPHTPVEGLTVARDNPLKVGGTDQILPTHRPNQEHQSRHQQRSWYHIVFSLSVRNSMRYNESELYVLFRAPVLAKSVSFLLTARLCEIRELLISL